MDFVFIHVCNVTVSFRRILRNSSCRARTAVQCSLYQTPSAHTAFYQIPKHHLNASSVNLINSSVNYAEIAFHEIHAPRDFQKHTG